MAQRIRANEILRNKLLSKDGNLTLIVLALDPDAVQSARLSHVVSQIRQTAREDLAGASLEASLTGVPVMQLEIRNALERDRIIYNAFGFAAGCLIAIVFFRRASYMMVAAGPPLLAILFGLGTLGWLDFQLNLFLNVMTPLIMVISFSDGMQLTFAARDRLIAGADRRTAFRDADPRRRACLRAYTWNCGIVLHCAPVLAVRPHPQLRRRGLDLDRDRACDGPDA